MLVSIVVLNLAMIGFAVGMWMKPTSKTVERLRVENFSLVKCGQSQKEVEALLGGPPGNYGRYARANTGIQSLEWSIKPPGSVEQYWCDDSNKFEVYFDKQGLVCGVHKRSYFIQTPPENVFKVLQRLVWRKLGY